jgi:hypothetical protein
MSWRSEEGRRQLSKRNPQGCHDKTRASERCVVSRRERGTVGRSSDNEEQQSSLRYGSRKVLEE